MKIALVDDEEFQLKMLADSMSASLAAMGFRNAAVAEFSSGEALLAEFERGKYDIIVLDIYMGGANGIDIARRIRALDAEVALAFCTSSNEFAAETYEVEAKFYLNKPISQEKIMTMLSRFNLASIERNRALTLPDGLRVPISGVLYTEYNNHRVTFHMLGIAPRTFYMTQGEAEDMLLPHKGFCVVTKGCIVNFAKVASIGANELIMQNGESIAVARRRFKEIENEYTRYRFERLNAEVSE